MYKIAIVEDEVAARDKLVEYIKRFGEENDSVVGKLAGSTYLARDGYDDNKGRYGYARAFFDNNARYRYS